MTSPSISLLSVNVAVSGFLGESQGEMIASGIRKQPLTIDRVAVGVTNIEGDGQADLVNHGGVEKAVYAYPFGHLVRWTSELEPESEFSAGSFGENLTIVGIDESTACIGDVWQWGDVVLQICQPRYPCFKLGMATGDHTVVRRLVENGRTGWYMRVLEPGVAPTRGQIQIVERGPDGVTVLEAHRSRLPGADLELVRRVAGAGGLATGLQGQFAEALVGST